jgi:hypothetical protein
MTIINAETAYSEEIKSAAYEWQLLQAAALIKIIQTRAKLPDGPIDPYSVLSQEEIEKVIQQNR